MLQRVFYARLGENEPETSREDWISRARTWTVARRRQRLRRQAFRSLLTVDDHILDDIGLSRTLVEQAARTPVTVDAIALVQNEQRAALAQELARDRDRRDAVADPDQDRSA
ncbi:hypothetical protein [Consotaella aegiceratis]|uniref:hypothetical protein n=1 Tax=Consotaella aegiceratis TaxID=3097961 RepID=UPI002F4133A9